MPTTEIIKTILGLIFGSGLSAFFGIWSGIKAEESEREIETAALYTVVIVAIIIGILCGIALIATICMIPFGGE